MLSRNRARKAPAPGQSGLTHGKGKQGRPMKRSRELAPSRQEVKRRQQALHLASQAKSQKHRSTRTLSTFEKLPTEIIQHIFFLSLEANLAATSQTLNITLSHESIFKTLLLFAFFEPDGISPVEKEHFFPAEYRHLDSLQRARLQRTIFNFKWCNRRRIDFCMPTLCRLAMVQAWHRERNGLHTTQPWATPGLLVGSSPSPGPDLVAGLSEDQRLELGRLPDIDDENAMRAHYFAREPKGSIESGRCGISPSIRVWSHSRKGTYPEDATAEPRKYVSGSAPVLAALFIPDKILRGSPWTDETHSLLRLLMEGLLCSAGNDRFLTDIDAEIVLSQGMESAIAETRLDVLESLLKISRRFKAHLPERPQLPTTLLHAALKLGLQASKYLDALLRSGIRLNGEDDEDLTAWALRAKKRGDPLGSWLLQTLEAPPSQRPRYAPRQE